MAFNGFYRVLQGFMGFYWMLRGSTEFYWVLLFFSGFYWVSVGFIGFYWVLLGLIVFFFPEAFGGCFCDVPTIKEHHPLPVDGTIDDVPVEERQHPSLLFVFFGIFFFSSLLVGFCLPIRPRKKKANLYGWR